MASFLSLDPKALQTSVLYNYLSNAVAPRPIALASTISKEGDVNLSPFSFFNVFSNNPPIMIFSPIRRSRDNSNKDTFENISEVKEVVINIVNFPIVEQTSLSSTEYEKGVNEFEKAGFTEIPSDLIAPPRVGESPVSFECVVEQIIPLGQEGGSGNLILSRVVKIHVNTDVLDPSTNMIDPVKLDLVGRMGGNWYNRCSIDALFEIPKPLRNKGIGINALPKHIRESPVLTGNELARISNIQRLPMIQNETKVNSAELGEIHRYAKRLIIKGDTEKALAILINNTPNQ